MEGSVFLDALGRKFDVVSNTTNRVTVDGKPHVPTTLGAKSRVSIDHKDTPNARATALEPTRPFFLLERKSFSRLNYRYRKATEGEHIHVLDDSSSKLLLATGTRVEGEVSRNTIEEHTLTQEQFDALEGFRAPM